MSSTHSGSSLDHTWPAKSDPGLTAMALLIRSRRSNPSPPFPGRHQTASVTSLPARGAHSSAYTQCVCDTMACQENSFHVRGEEEWVDHGVVIAPDRCIVLDPLVAWRPSSLSPTCPSLGLSVFPCPTHLHILLDSSGIRKESALEGREHARILPFKMGDAIGSFEPATGRSESRGPPCCPAWRLWSG